MSYLFILFILNIRLEWHAKIFGFFSIFTDIRVSTLPVQLYFVGKNCFWIFPWAKSNKTTYCFQYLAHSYARKKVISCKYCKLISRKIPNSVLVLTNAYQFICCAWPLWFVLNTRSFNFCGLSVLLKER